MSWKTIRGEGEDKPLADGEGAVGGVLQGLVGSHSQGDTEECRGTTIMVHGALNGPTVWMS